MYVTGGGDASGVVLWALLLWVQRRMCQPGDYAPLLIGRGTTACFSQ